MLKTLCSLAFSSTGSSHLLCYDGAKCTVGAVILCIRHSHTPPLSTSPVSTLCPGSLYKHRANTGLVQKTVVVMNWTLINEASSFRPDLPFITMWHFSAGLLHTELGTQPTQGLHTRTISIQNYRALWSVSSMNDWAELIQNSKTLHSYRCMSKL